MVLRRIPGQVPAPGRCQPGLRASAGNETDRVWFDQFTAALGMDYGQRRVVVPVDQADPALLYPGSAAAGTERVNKAR